MPCFLFSYQGIAFKMFFQTAFPFQKYTIDIKITGILVSFVYCENQKTTNTRNINLWNVIKRLGKSQ